MTVKFRFKELHAIKERREGRRIPYRTVASEAGLSTGILVKMANNTVKSFRMDALQKITDWLGCQPGDLIVKE